MQTTFETILHWKQILSTSVQVHLQWNCSAKDLDKNSVDEPRSLKRIVVTGEREEWKKLWKGWSATAVTFGARSSDVQCTIRTVSGCR